MGFFSVSLGGLYKNQTPEQFVFGRLAHSKSFSG